MDISSDQPILTPEQARVAPWFAIDGDKTLRLDYPLNKDSLVYDVGGYLGEWAGPIYDRYGCRIEIFEPIGSFVTKLNNKFKNNPKIQIHDFGLGGKSRNLPILVDEASSSTFKSQGKKQNIKIVAAQKILPPNTKVDLIKINIEGGEYELLDHLIETGLINNIDNIQVQFHIFVPQAPQKRKALQNKLAKSHELIYSYPWIWENWRLKR